MLYSTKILRIQPSGFGLTRKEEKITNEKKENNCKSTNEKQQMRKENISGSEQHLYTIIQIYRICFPEIINSFNLRLGTIRSKARYL